MHASPVLHQLLASGTPKQLPHTYKKTAATSSAPKIPARKKKVARPRAAPNCVLPRNGGLKITSPACTHLDKKTLTHKPPPPPARPRSSKSSTPPTLASTLQRRYGVSGGAIMGAVELETSNESSGIQSWPAPSRLQLV